MHVHDEEEKVNMQLKQFPGSLKWATKIHVNAIVLIQMGGIGDASFCFFH